jgi:hypothetical protein
MGGGYELTWSTIDGGEFPPELARLLGDLVWCDQAGDYVKLADPTRVVLTPRPLAEPPYSVKGWE